MASEPPGVSKNAGKVYQLAQGVQDVGPISGTLEEIIEILEGYPFQVVHQVFTVEMFRRSALFHALTEYYADRFIGDVQGRLL